MKKIQLILLMVTLSVQAVAQNQQISMTEASHAAVTWLINRVNPSSLTITNVYADTGHYGISLYEVETSIGQTVLLSGSRACLPILGVHCSDEGSYIENDSLPCGLQFMMDYYKERIDTCLSDKRAKLYYEKQWDSLIRGIPPTVSRNVPIAPMLSSNWRQKYPNDNMYVDAYNAQTPSGNGCSHCRVGCVAVAMGQLMYYWQYPVVTKKFVKQFDWCNMTDNLYTSEPLYTKHRDAIAHLLRKCGKVIDMEYGCESSSAHTSDAADALEDWFGYHEDIDFKRKIWYSYHYWEIMVLNNLYAGRPVIYSGQRGWFTGGPAFVCDGYDGRNLFHFNWGWNAQYNRALNMFTLNDPAPRGDTNYQYWQGAIFNAYPATHEDLCNVDLELQSFYLGNQLLDNNAHQPYEITPMTMTTLTSAAFGWPFSWRTIPDGATALYQAHKEINLQDGFEAELGCEFEARIEPCEQCDELGENILSGDEENEDFENGNDNEMLYSAGKPTQAVATDLFPNPTDGPLTMLVDSEAQDVFVFTLDGRPVGGWRLTACTKTAVTLDVSPLAPAAYLLSVRTSSGLHTARFIRQ